MPEEMLQQVIDQLHELVEELSATEARLTEKIDEQDRRQDRHRRAMRRTLAFMFAAVAVVSVIAAVTIRNNQQAAAERDRQTSEAVAAARRVSCEQSNQVRQGMLSLADYIEQVSTTARPDATPEERAAIESRAAARQGTVDEMRRLNQLLDCSAPVEPTPKDG